MKKIAVIYKSKYGTTEKYANWIAEELGATLLEESKVKPTQLAEYDIVVYGGWLFASKISGVKLVTGNPCKALVVFSVGITDPKTMDTQSILKENFKPELLEKIKVFHLRGGVDFNKLGFIHKNLLNMVKSAAEKKTPEERSAEERAIVEASSGSKSDFTDKASIAPLVEYVRTL